MGQISAGDEVALHMYMVIFYVILRDIPYKLIVVHCLGWY